MKIRDLFDVVKNTSGTNAKKQLLADNMSDLLVDIFEMTYGDHNYFVTKIDIDSCPLSPRPDGTYLSIEEGWDEFKQILQQCEARYITGNEARRAIESGFGKFWVEDAEVLYRILQHNLKIGVSMKNFCSITGTSSNEYQVSLAENLKNAKGVNPIDGTYFASRKLDGCRCTFFIEKTATGVDVKIPRSRQNKEFTTLRNLIPSVAGLTRNLPNVGKYVLDGEVCILDENGDEHFDWVMKEITRKNHTITSPCYNIFDLVTEDEFYGRVQSPIFSERLDVLLSIFDKYVSNGGSTDRLHVLKQERITSQEDFDRWSTYVKDGNWEGFMLRKDVVYKGGRSKDLLKVKLMQDAEYVVLDTVNSKITYNEDGQKEFDACSSLVIKHKGNDVYVGSGLSKEQRLRWFEHPEEIIGKTITVQYFEETMDKKTKKYSLRFPILKYVYDGERTV